MSTSKPRIPAVGEYVRGQGVLVGIEDPPAPPPPPKEYIFEEIMARQEIRYNGQVLKELRTLWDFSGLGSSVTDAIEEAKQYAVAHKIGPRSDIEVVVVKVVSRVRKRPMPDENFYDKNFRRFEPLEHGSCRGTGPAVETVVWSSKAPNHI